MGRTNFLFPCRVGRQRPTGTQTRQKPQQNRDSTTGLVKTTSRSTENSRVPTHKTKTTQNQHTFNTWLKLKVEKQTLAHARVRSQKTTGDDEAYPRYALPSFKQSTQGYN